MNARIAVVILLTIAALPPLVCARNFQPATGRYVEADPSGLPSGPNRYTYAEQSPLLFTDPYGLYTEIIQWGSAPGFEGRWGHISGNINGDNYSFGPKGWDSRFSAAQQYAQRQADPDIDREGKGVVLDLNPQEEKQLAMCVKSFKNYNPLTNNCGNPWLQCLQAAGLVSTRNRPTVLPADVLGIIGSSPRAIGNTRYSGNRTLFGSPHP